MTGIVRSRMVRSAAVEQRTVEQLERAAEDQLVQVEGPDHGRQRHAELDADLGQRRPGRRAASSRRSRGAASTVSRQPRRPQAHSLAVGVDHDVADLAGRRAVTVQQRALEHQPGADTGADPEHHQPAVAGVAERVLAEDGGVGVVGHEDREVEGRAQPGGQRGAVPAEVGGVDDDAGGVDDAGAADADAEHRPVGRVDELADQVVQQGDRVLATAPVERAACAGPGPCRPG